MLNIFNQSFMKFIMIIWLKAYLYNFNLCRKLKERIVVQSDHVKNVEKANHNHKRLNNTKVAIGTSKAKTKD